jgi:hypothetical protein
MRNSLELVEVDGTRLEEVLRRVEQSLDEEDAALVRAVFESYAYVSDLVEDKDTSIRRLRQPVSSGSWGVSKRSILLLRSLLENAVGRCMVTRHARLHLLMSTTAGTPRFPPAIAPCASQTVPQPHS